jgi:hypothetical protein
MRFLSSGFFLTNQPHILAFFTNLNFVRTQFKILRVIQIQNLSCAMCYWGTKYFLAASMD